MNSALRALKGVALTIVALPFAIAAGFLSKGRRCAPREFASDLRKFADGIEGPSDWDRLECVPIVDRRLETIRQEAMSVELPLRPEDRAKLGQLADKAEALSIAK